MGVAALLLGAAAGCMQGKGSGGPAGSGGGSGGGEGGLGSAWEPGVAGLRIYPSTRFIKEKDTSLLEARIELLDEMGDSIKASGQLRFELRGAGQRPGVEEGRLLYSWDITIATLDDQRRYYDPITRSYLLRLRLSNAAITQRQVVLRVTFQPVDGVRMTDEQPVRINW